MPLDPQVRTFLDQIGAPGAPQLHEVPVDEARRMMEMMSNFQGAGESVLEVRDVEATGPDGAIPVRVYRPAAGTLALLVYFHGGGWVLGSRDTHDRICRALANRTHAVVVSVDYRLAPEHRFPAAAEDAYAATVWAVEQASALDVDADRVAVAGDSAGGNLAAVVSLMARDRGGPGLRHQLLVYPVVDGTREYPSHEENAEGYFLTTATMRWFWGHYAPDAAARRNPYASPIRADDLSGLPPAFVLTAEFDPLRDEGEAYAEALAKARVPVRLERYGGQIHGFFGMTSVFDAARRAFDEAAGTLRRALV